MNPALRLAVVVLISTWAATPIRAAPPDDPPSTAKDVEALAAEARKLFQDEHYEEAISAYLRAYRLAPAGALLYNIAFIYDKKLGERELAMDFYRRYIGSSDADPDVVQRANTRIGELKLEKEPKTGTINRPLDTKDTGAPGNLNPPRVEPPPPAPSSPQRLWGWVTLGVGSAVLATGAGLGVAAKFAHDDFSSSTNLSEKQDLQSRGKTFALAGDILMGTGVAAIAAGLVLALTAPSSPVGVGAAPVEGGAIVLFGGSL